MKLVATKYDIGYLQNMKLVTNVIIFILINSSFCVLNFIFPSCRSNFGETACTTYKTEQPCNGRLWWGGVGGFQTK